MRIYFVYIFLFFSNLSSFAAISDYYKEVLQRGYIIQGDSVQLPDGQYCLIEDFNNNRCGQEWKNKDYCIPEGGLVWDPDRCCEGLEAWQDPDRDGHTICKKKKNESIMFKILLFSCPILLVLFFLLKRKGDRIKKQKQKRFGSNR